MISSRFLIAAAAAFLGTPLAAAVTVVGGSAARQCYEAAEFSRTSLPAALESCDAALRDEPLTGCQVVGTHVNRGVIKLRQGDVEGAVADFDAAIARDPDHPEAYLNKGVALLQDRAKAEAARSLFSMAIEKKTRKPAVAYLGRGMAQEELGQLRAAYADYGSASAADPAWDQPRLELSRFKVKAR